MKTLRFAHLDPAMRIVEDLERTLLTAGRALSPAPERIALPATSDSPRYGAGDRTDGRVGEAAKSSRRDAASEVLEQNQEQPDDREYQDDPLDGPER